MRARNRVQSPEREDYDSFDAPPPEVFDAQPEVAVDEAPMELSVASGSSLTAPVHACLVCGDDPSIDSGCPHFEVVTVRVLSSALAHTLAELRAHHEALRESLRALRRLSATALAMGDATVEVREPPVVAPRVVLIPPPSAKRPRRVVREVVEQRYFGFAEPPPARDDR